MAKQLRKFNQNSLVIVFVLVVSVAFLQGCAVNKPFVKKDLVTLSPLKVVRYQTTEFTKETLGGNIGGVLLGGALGAALIAKSSGKKLREKAALPDFGSLVMKKFVKHVSKEIPNWPTMTIEDQPVSPNYTHELGTLLEFKVIFVGLHFSYGFVSHTVVTMKDSNGSVLWKKKFAYDSNKFDRKRSIDEFEADNGELLKEEMKFAAEKTVSDFIEHFKGGK